MHLRLDITWTGDVAVVRCHGVIVFGYEADELRLTVLSLLKQTNHLVLVLAGIERIDSEGVAALVGVFISARNRGGELKLAELSPECQRVLQITRVNKVFEIHETEARAVASFHPDSIQARASG